MITTKIQHECYQGSETGASGERSHQTNLTIMMNTYLEMYLSLIFVRYYRILNNTRLYEAMKQFN